MVQTIQVRLIGKNRIIVSIEAVHQLLVSLLLGNLETPDKKKLIELHQNQLRKLIRSGLDTAQKELSAEAHIKGKAGTIVEVEENMHKATAECPICDKKFSLYRTGKNWVVSNFITHYRKIHKSAEIRKAKEEQSKKRIPINSVQAMFAKKTKSNSSISLDLSEPDDELQMFDSESENSTQVWYSK